MADTERTLPADLLLEIIARSDVRTLVRCAAACKNLRRDILDPSFINRITQQGGIVPPWILAYINNTHDDKDDPPPPLTLVHPATPAAMLFSDGHLSWYMSRFADGILGEHYLVTSRNGLVLFRRRHASNRLPYLCVYDAITGHRTFLSGPPGIDASTTRYFDKCILLTAADGINCNFMLFVPNLVTLSNNSHTIEVHINTSTCGTWETSVMSHGLVLPQWFAMHGEAAVLHGGVIHWLLPPHCHILTYNICTKEHGTINLPSRTTNIKRRLHLGSHDNRKLLRVLGADGFNISVWDQLPSGDWSLEAMAIDREEKLQSLDPDICTGRLLRSKYKSSVEGTSAVLVHLYVCGSVKNRRFLLIILDLETKEMSMQEYSTSSALLFFEVDLPSRLRGMKNSPN